jgi:hypothetical protein
MLARRLRAVKGASTIQSVNFFDNLQLVRSRKFLGLFGSLSWHKACVLLLGNIRATGGRIMKAKNLVLAATTVFALGAASQAHAVSIVNGSFETGDLTGWGGTVTTDGNGLNPFGTAFGTGMDGTYWAWLAGFEIGRDLTQTITGLTPGASYRISFIMASEFVNFDQLNVSVDGNPFTVFIAPPINGNFWDNWVSQSIDFSASGATADLLFSTFGLNAAGYDVGLDNVTIRQISDVTVPEPASIALFAAGLAGLGWMSRRRKA